MGLPTTGGAPQAPAPFAEDAKEKAGELKGDAKAKAEDLKDQAQVRLATCRRGLLAQWLDHLVGVLPACLSAPIVGSQCRWRHSTPLS